jgi:hypothetical protein
MKKIRVHIENEDTFLDENVFVDITLPAVPRKGDRLYLTEEAQTELENKAKLSIKVATSYAPLWFYGHTSIYLSKIKEWKEDTLKPEHLKDLSFDDANTVSGVAFDANSDIVHVELNM